MSIQDPEPWLRGSIPGIPPLLQPVAHALLFSLENIRTAVENLSHTQVWLEIGGVASVGFHLRHLAGSTDRLFTYARGAELSDTQRSILNQEKPEAGNQPAVEALLLEWEKVIQAAFAQLKITAESSLTDERLVGRAQLPSTVLGLLFHAAEHASRHTGQIVTTAKLTGKKPSAD